MKTFIKKYLSTIILIAIFFIGLSLLLYPTLSDYWNSFHQSRAIASYAEAVANLDDNKYEEILNSARSYNAELAKKAFNLMLGEEELNKYNDVLDVDGTGIMAYIEVPKIKCNLPIYHGTDEAVLQIAIGHIAGTSLPIGGESTHCVLSGHRGLPSAKLFTDIDKLVVGDTFIIRTLDEVFTYEVDKINIVLPAEVDLLRIEEGEDLCTLVTCTPYGVNTHRLLVRGHRIANENSKIRVTSDAQQIEPIIVAPMVAVPLIFILLVIVLIDTKKRKEKLSRRKRLHDKNEENELL